MEGVNFQKNCFKNVIKSKIGDSPENFVQKALTPIGILVKI
jgi:hypothetical protein